MLIGSSLYGSPSSSRVMEALVPFGVGQEYNVMLGGMAEWGARVWIFDGILEIQEAAFK